MSESLVSCPKCAGRRRLVAIIQLEGEEIRRFRCDQCKADADYIIRRGMAMPRKSND